MISRSYLDPGSHILFLDALEVELGEDVQPVGDLDDEEELVHEAHVDVRVGLPEAADVEQLIPHDDVDGPDGGDQVEGQELAGLVELGVLHLGEVQLAGHLVQDILLEGDFNCFGYRELDFFPYFVEGSV